MHITPVFCLFYSKGDNDPKTHTCDMELSRTFQQWQVTLPNGCIYYSDYNLNAATLNTHSAAINENRQSEISVATIQY